MRLFVQCRRPAECARRDVGWCRHARPRPSSRAAAQWPRGYRTFSGSRGGVAPAAREWGGRRGCRDVVPTHGVIQSAPLTSVCTRYRIKPIRTGSLGVYSIYRR